MADIRPFCAVRPVEQLVSRIAALPYDVYKRADALEEVTREPLSFLHIDRPETWFDDSVDIYDPRVYAKAREVMDDWRKKGYFIQDQTPCYYIYEQTMDGRSQAGIVACASVNDYLDHTIKKHESTRASKEQDRINHIEACQAQTGPIFLAYREDQMISGIVQKHMENTPVYEFTAPDGVVQRVWIINDPQDIITVQNCFSKIKDIYIADGHHRAASAVKVSVKKREALGIAPNGFSGDESDTFLCVLFPHNSLKIMPYHRIVKDLNGHSPESFLEKLTYIFNIEKISGDVCEKPVFPETKACIGMYLNHSWYRLKLKDSVKEKIALSPENITRQLDVSVLQDYVLEPLLGITDPRRDRRIDFVGGIYGLKALEKYCDEKEWAAAFAMYPTSIDELFTVADNNAMMPPKSTWFEPKLRSGLFIHLI